MVSIVLLCSLSFKMADSKTESQPGPFKRTPPPPRFPAPLQPES
ncbi:unnamed protein product [Nyctereutes procyonoides]|uniref:(raccoon dog) hypothetical protein n=1 Tax=Nyctereutes procyonoides TaxID=34880 RepID=A0A811ZNQ5_NYCPR|nr:unnamed protein product [Nyctereutes procyonoides]